MIWGLMHLSPKWKSTGVVIEGAHATDVYEHEDHMGWHEQGDGNWFYGLNIENGRIKDTEKMKLKTALARSHRTLRPGVHLTAHQSLIFTNVADDKRAVLEEILLKHGVVLESVLIFLMPDSGRWHVSRANLWIIDYRK